MANTAQQLADAFILSASAVNGNLVQANGSTVALATTGVLGAVQTSLPLAAGAQASVVLNGRATVRLVAGLTPTVGASLYLSSTAGLATTVSNSVAIGVVRSVISTTLVTADLALATTGTVPSTALWPLATIRYYAVDYNNGNDSNVGYSDVSMAAAGAVAIKTLTQLRAIIPNNGAGRLVVIAINGNADGITDLQYLKPDGVTLDNLDFRGVSGYRQALIRSTNGFANSTTDKIVCATAVGLAGPDAGGVWTCAGGATTTIFTITSGTLTAEPGLNGMRVRFTGNVTAALANQAYILQRNTSTQITLGKALTVAPAAGDTFVIERPGISVDNIYINSDVGGGSPLLATGAYGTLVVGVRARQTTTALQFITTVSARLNLSFVEFDQRCSIYNVNFLACTATYIDEVGTSVISGVGLRWFQSGTSVMFSIIPGNLFLTECALTGLSANSFVNRALVLTWAQGCYINTSGFLLTCSGTSGNRSGVFGSNGATANGRLVLSGRMSFIGAPTPVNGVDLINAGAAPCLTFSDTLTGGLPLGLGNLFSSSGGNTDVIADFTGLTQSTINLTGTLTAGMATVGDIRTGGGAVIPFTTPVADAYVDTQGNTYRAAASTGISRRTPGIFYNVPILTVDPTTPLDGDVWITNITGTRSLCCRIGGTTYRSTLT